jgi:pyruvate,water dikinase
MQSVVRQQLVEWLGATDAPPSEWDALLGGKAASLERLLRMGAPTPPAFCLTTDAFGAHLAAEAHAGEARAAISRLPDAAAAATLTTLLLEAPLPARLAAQVEVGLDRLGAEAALADPPIAVRSSAVGEDGRAASFAGIHETELDRSRDEVEAAIRHCWASLWSERALEYRVARGLPLDGAMAVVVQLLVPADAAAVVFTRHPVTGSPDEILINATHGLGEALVSGLVTPDELVLARSDLLTLSFSAGDSGLVLSDDQLRDLAVLCLDLERKFGKPIDVEAAHADGRWYILQARPITA